MPLQLLRGRCGPPVLADPLDVLGYLVGGWDGSRGVGEAEGTGLGCVEDAGWGDAKDQRREGCEAEGCGYGQSDPGSGYVRSSRGQRLGDGDCQFQVVRGGQSGVEKADEAEPDGSALQRGREGVELAEEAGGEGDSDERSEEEDEQAAKERGAVDEAAIVADEGQVLVVACYDGDNGEDADVHGRVSGDVEARGGNAGHAEAGEGCEQVAGVGNGGIGQHALDVVLAQSGEVADGHGEDGDDPHQGLPHAVEHGEAREEQADEDGEGGNLGRSRQEGYDGGWCAFIDVRGPDVEGSGGDFEEDADHEKGEGGEDEVAASRMGDQGADFVDLRGARSAEDEGHSVEEEAGGEGAEKEVFDGGFGALAGVFAEAGENVGRDGGDFEGDENNQELDRRGHQAHADCAEDHQGEVFAAMVLVGGQGVEGDEQGDEDDSADEDVEEDAEGIGLNGVVEGRAGGQGKLPQAGPEGDQYSKGSEPAEAAAAGDWGESGVEKHDEDAGDREDDFRQDSKDVRDGGQVHFWPPLSLGAFLMLSVSMRDGSNFIPASWRVD